LRFPVSLPPPEIRLTERVRWWLGVFQQREFAQVPRPIRVDFLVIAFH
jgi:hypothetical protein